MDETTPDPVGQALENAELEAAIEACVRNFYAKGRNDEVLGPVFNSTVTDWERHFKRIQNFWSRMLLGTTRYSGHPYPAHVHLPVEPEHFVRWVALFEETARETLAPDLAEKAISRARHMSLSFQAGIFPFKDEHGRPSRLPHLARKEIR